MPEVVLFLLLQVVVVVVMHVLALALVKVPFYRRMADSKVRYDNEEAHAHVAEDNKGDEKEEHPIVVVRMARVRCRHQVPKAAGRVLHLSASLRCRLWLRVHLRNSLPSLRRTLRGAGQ